MVISFISNNIKTIAGVGGALFISYAIYFDYKRHKDPLFKQKLRERRRIAAENEKQAREVKLPESLDPKTVSEFFQQCMVKGENCLGQDKLEEAAEHFTFAASLSNTPMQMLQFFKQSLPEEVMALIYKKIPTVNEKLSAHFKKLKNVLAQSQANDIFDMFKKEVEEPLDEPKLPNVITPSSMQEFCMECLKKADEFTVSGQVDKAAELYSYALNLAENPQIIHSLFEQSMPEPMLAMVIAKVPETRKKIQAHFEAHPPEQMMALHVLDENSEDSSGVLVEDEVE